MKAILIDSTKREIREVEYSGLQDLHRLVGGYIEVAWHNDHGDIMFVDEEGKLKRYPTCFLVRGVHDILAGNGLVVGRETEEFTRTGDVITLDPVVTVEMLRSLVKWGTKA